MRRTVTKIIDGDTVVVNRKVGNTRYIRLASVNAPELHSRGGSKARNILKRLIGGKSVSITPKGRSYNRIVADVRLNRKSINKRMRQRGY